MKSFNMVSLMAKASRNNKSAVARSEEAKKEALAAREAREAELKAMEAERLEKKAQKDQAREVSPLAILQPKLVDAPEKDIATQNISDVRFILEDWKKSMLANPAQFMETWRLVNEVADEYQVAESLRMLNAANKPIQEYHALSVRLNALRDRQTKVKTNCMAKVIPWDQAAREAVVLAEDAFGANAPEIGKEAKRLLNDINLTK